MKALTKLLLSAVLLLSLVFVPTLSSDAATVTPGFYKDNVLDLSLTDFQKMSKKEKKAYIKTASKSHLVLGNLVYDFGKVLTLPANVEPEGITIEEYQEKYGELKESTGTEPEPVLFEVISIE